MAVDDLREIFHINKIAPSELQDFLTAQTYRPDITISYQKIFELRNKTLQQLCASKIQQGSTPVYANIGPVCLKSKQVGEIVVSDFTDTCVDEEWAKKNLKSKVSTGDVLLTRQGTGTIGRAGLYLGAGAYTNDSLFKISIDKADSAYVCAFLSTFIGHRLIEKGVYGSTGQLNLSVEHVKRLPVPVFDQQSQKYIGDKVRQAEQLRAWAKRLEVQFQGKLATSYPEAFENKRTGRKYSKAPVDDISYTLNPGAFDEERLRIRLYLKSLGAKKLREIATIEGPTSSSYLPDSKYIGLDAISSNSCALSPSTVGESEVTGTSRLLSEGPVVAKLRPYLNKVSYIPKWLSGAVGSTELLCVKATDVTNNWYLYGVLKSDITLLQLKPLASGSTHPRIDQYDLYDVVVPIHQNHELMGSWLEDAQCAYFAASQLVQTSKKLVEALIEGQLTEQQLIQAQQALDDGDNSLDQAILSKLSNEGYAIEGATPLFSDLDELYRLLESAAQAEGEE